MFTLIFMLFGSQLRRRVFFNDFDALFEAEAMRFGEMISHRKPHLLIFYLNGFGLLESIQLFRSCGLGLLLECGLIGVRTTSKKF